MDSSGSLTPAQDTPKVRTPSHHLIRNRHHLSHPDGRQIHIAQTPEDHLKLQDELSKACPEDDFHVMIQGSTEHFAVIRELHAHHEARRESLRQEHGSVFEQFEKVREDLDHLARELNQMSDHGVEFDANFSKFGYSANVRTKDGSGSGNATPNNTHHNADHHQNRMHEGIKFFKRPVVRQYFHKGLLWRSAKSGEVGTFELFTDLLYVGIIGIIGDRAVELSNGKSLLEYCVNFSMAFKIWSDLTLISNMFERDDVVQKVTICFYLCNLFGYTTNIAYAFEKDTPGAPSDTYIPMMSFYLANRFMGTLYYSWLAYVVPMIRGTIVFQALVMALGAVLWIASIHVRYPSQLALIWIAIAIDTLGNFGGIWMSRARRTPGTAWQRFADRHLSFYPAVNIEHRTERTNAFVSLVFGYSVLTILFQSRARIGLNAFLGKGILGLVQAFAFQWLYFEIDHHCVHVHAIRRHWFTSIVWITTHLPFVLSYTLAAATLSKLVLAHDCSNAPLDDLGDTYAVKSAAGLNSGLRWFYCGGIGVSLLCMALLSFCHIHKKIALSRLRKRQRLAMRVVIAVVIICLPAAGGRLTSLSTISITTGLVVLTLMIDIFGNSTHGDGFWTEGWSEESKRKTGYTTDVKIGKKKRIQLEKALRKGEKMNLADLRRRESELSLESVETGDAEKRRRDGDEEWMHTHF